MGVAIGIDFGTTNTVITYKNKKGYYRQIQIKNGEILNPSIIHYKSKDDYVIGMMAKNAEVGPTKNACIKNFKMALGDNKKIYEIQTASGDRLRLTPKRVTREFMNKLITSVETKLAKEFGAEEGVIDRIVITVPAKFNDVKKSEIKSAITNLKTSTMGAANLTIDKIKLVPEPTAAAVAASANDEDDEPILIYDFGGGTFDVAVMKKEGGVYKQIELDGDPTLGGNNLTEILAEYLLDEVNTEFDTDFPMDKDIYDEEEDDVTEEHYLENIENLRREAENIKKDLSNEDETEADDEVKTEIALSMWTQGNEQSDFSVEVTRAEFNGLIEDKIDDTVKIVERVLESEEVANIGGVHKIVLAGGSSRIPLIKQKLEERFADCEVTLSDSAMVLISEGAARLAENIEDIESKTEAKTSMDLGVIATRGLNINGFQTIIPFGAKLPANGKLDFEISDNQELINVQYCQRDIRNYPKAGRIGDDGIELIDTLAIDLPKGLKAANTKVQVGFYMKADGSLDINADVLDGMGNIVASGEVHREKQSDLI